jgi:RNA polymerase sigma factor (sigma-70 family)
MRRSSSQLASANDANLLRSSRRDDRAFRVLYDRHAMRVCRHLESRYDSRESALDLTAEVFARAWLQRSRFRDECAGSALPWLLGIARNALRTSRVKQRIETEARQRLAVDYREVVIESDSSWLDADDDAIDAALRSLPAAEQAAVALRVLESLPYRDVAARLDCTEAAARVRVHRTLSKLRTILQETPT